MLFLAKNKTFLFFIIVCFSFESYSQYSRYYNIDHNINHKIDKKVTVDGHITSTQTIHSIDYGALALAYTEYEKNRLEKMKYNDQKEIRIRIDIAHDPSLAFDHGTRINSKCGGGDNVQQNHGFKSMRLHGTRPHKFLFNPLSELKWQNISTDFITTTITIFPPWLSKEVCEEPKKKQRRKEYTKEYWAWKECEESRINNPVKNYLKYPDMIVREINMISKDSRYLHKKDLNRCTVFGKEGYKGTLIWEDDFEKGITDSYITFQNNILYWVKVDYIVDKDALNFENVEAFEKLEGRRYYLKRLIDKTIADLYIKFSPRLEEITKENGVDVSPFLPLLN